MLDKIPLERSAPIQKALVNDILKLCNCEYGNYIMQHLLRHGPEEERQMLYKVLE
jgi:hypothetical protein